MIQPSSGGAEPLPRDASASLGDGVIFLLGLPRSGTTLLQRLLGEHPAIHTVAEPWLMLPLSELLSGRLGHSDYDSALAAVALDAFALELPGGRAELVDGVRRMAVELYASCRGQTGARHFLDKTPRYHYIVDELLELLPQAKFVMLRRNPLSILASVSEAWCGGSVAAALGDPYHGRDLTSGFAHLDAAATTLGDRACQVRYESLVTDSEAELRRLCTFLEIDFDPSMLRYDPDVRFKGSFGDDIGLPTHRGPSGASLDKWQAALLRPDNVHAALRFLRDTPASSFLAAGVDRDALGAELEAYAGRYPEMPATPPAATGGAVARRLRAAEQRVRAAGARLVDEARIRASVPNEAAGGGEPPSAEIPRPPDARAVLGTLRDQGDRVRALELGFEVALGRTPSDDELAHWWARVDDGMTPWEMVASLAAGSDVRVAAGERDDAVARLLRAAYQRYLGREPAAEEIAVRIAGLDAGASPWGLLPPIAESTEAVARRETGERVRLRSVWLGFEVALGRMPSEVELAYWCGRVDEGFMPWDVVASLVSGVEERVGEQERDGSVRAMVRAAYRRFLYRDAGDGEVAGWVGDLDAGLSPWAVLDAIAGSDEVGAVLDGVNSSTLAACALEPLYGKALSPAELVEWKHRLDTVPTARGEVVLQAMLGEVRHAIAQRSGQVASAPHPQELLMMGTTDMISPQIWEARAREIAAEPRRDESARASVSYTPTGQPRVSVIASLYRGGRYIERFLDMIVNQTMGPDVELIIVDAHSPEGEAEVIERYQAAYPGIVHYRADRRIGIYQAWNIGVELAHGDYLTNANMDDIRAFDSLQRQVEVLDRYPWVDVVYQDFLYTLDDTLDFDTIARFGFRSDLPIVTPANLMRYNSPHNAPMWRRALHDDVGLFDEFLRSAGDYDFWMRCVAAGKTFFKINEPHVAYFQNPAGMSTDPDGPGLEEGIRSLRKHARSLVPAEIFVDDATFRDELESLCGSRLDASSPTRFYDLAQQALEHLWRSDMGLDERVAP